MRLSQGVEWSVHCCTLLAGLPPGEALPAARLAEFHGTPAAYLAKHLQALSAAGILESVHGPRGGYRLARPAAEITVLDVVEAVEGGDPAFRCAEIRQRGPSAGPPEAYRGRCGIASAFDAADAAWRTELASHTVAGLLDGVVRGLHPEVAARTITWIQEVRA